MLTRNHDLADSTSALRIRREAVESCPVCRGVDRREEIDGVRDYVCGLPGTTRYVRCLDCGLIYQDPRPIVEDLPLCYSKYHTHEPDALPEAFREAWGANVRWIRGGILAKKFGYVHLSPSPLAAFAACCLDFLPFIRSRARCGLGDILPKFHGDGRALDIGTGGGVFAATLARLGWNVTGIDFDRVAATKTANLHNLRIIAGTLEEIHFADNHFNFVSMFHVIEHLPDPVKTLRECRRVMKSGARIAVTTPNYDCFTRVKFHKYWRGFEAPRHLILFDFSTLTKALRDAGFTITKGLNSSGFTRYSVAESARFQSDENGKTSGANMIALRAGCYNVAASIARIAGYFWSDALYVEAVK